MASDITLETETLHVPQKAKLAACVLVTVLAAEAIGPVKFAVGRGNVTLLPLLWAMIIAAGWGMAACYLPRILRIDAGSQVFSGSLLNAALLLLVVKLALTVGGGAAFVWDAGWALVFQELGHVFGTMVIALPVAIMLGVKREAVGATFSIGREGNLVIIGERYGMNSAEGRGVLAEYMTGTVLGALYVALLATLITSLGIFDPRSLAMGAGIGSGSMMAAATGAIIAQQPPEMAKQLTAIAAASNLITTVAGFYFSMLVSLPLASRLYDVLEPILGRRITTDTDVPTERNVAGATQPDVLSLPDALLAWSIVGVGVLIAGALSFKTPVAQSLLGMIVIIAIVAAGHLVKLAFPRAPMVILISAFTTLIAFVKVPLLQEVLRPAQELNFLAFTTPVLAIAGFAVAKDMPIFRKLGWRIVFVSLLATTGTFLGATLVAELFHR